MRRIDRPGLIAALSVVLGAAVLVALPPRARADEPPARAQRAIGYTVWNDEYLFFAARVDDVSLIGINETAMSEAWRDDSVDLYLNLTGEPSDNIHPQCARVAVSVASGFTCLVGTPAGTWRAARDWLMGLKLSVEREGTLNRSVDTDTGYTIEIGIPWKFLGGPPQPGRRIGFNFVVHVRGENETSVSWASRAQSPDDFDRPRLWGTLVINPSPKPAVAENDILVCPRTYNPPLVDGTLRADEWLAASVVQLEKPAPELVLQPAAGKPGGRLLATYRYDYQPQSSRGGEAAPALADQPPDGIGPGFSTDRVAWHKAMLRQARQAAVDTILPVYRGDPTARRHWSRLGLLRLVQALKETKDGRMSYPLVAMYLDAGCLSQAGAADLTTAAGRQAAWGMIAEFFGIVPEEFRAQFDIGSGDRSNLLVLGPPTKVENWDPAVVDFCRSMYLRTFGARLIVLGDEAWRAKAPNLDGYCSLEPGVALSYGKEGPRPIMRLTPGCLGPGPMLPRQGGQMYEQNWMRALAVLPEFVVVDSLNDFAGGSEIAASRQWGVRFLDITRQSAQVLAGRREYQVAVRRETLPPVLEPGATYQIELLVENQGFQDLVEGQRVEISYTLQNRKRPDLRRTGVATSKLFVLAGQRAPIVVEVSTRQLEGPLPPGDYDLTFEVTKSSIPILRSKWFAKQLFEISVPVRVGRALANRATVLSTDLPSALGAGGRKRVRVRLRNDGSRTWHTKDTALSYHWIRVPGFGASAPAATQIVEWEGVRAPVPKDVRPGEMITMYAWVEARKADGTPLPAWTPEDDWLYQLQWDVVEGEDRWFSRLGAEAYPEMVAVASSDLGATVVDADLPASLTAGEAYPVKVLVRNDGSSAWDPEHVRLSYHWYYWDGAEAAWQGPVTQLPAPVGAGESAMLTAQVTAPDFPGSYRLAWDLMLDDRFASEILDASARGLFTQSVSVSGGMYQPLDLSEQLNVFASTHDGYRSRGAFDAAGFSFPAEFIPPDSAAATVETYPGAYFEDARGWGSLARVPLRYPPMDQRGGAAIACTGQQIPLPKLPLRAVYIAAAATTAIDAPFAIAYPDGTSETAVLRVPSWTAPLPDVPVAVRAPFRRGTQEDVSKPACIYLLRVGDVARREAPTALVLPTAPDIKVFAITVERSSAGTSGGS
ncbi:MAG: hypothetical protein JSV65_14735 [Armatimonadota bacterium]|nr:MAG: hypothetical protein JSV65_14735 [Armatimonadota bacterium]